MTHFYLFICKLSVGHRYRIVPLRFKPVSSNRLAQIVLFSKFFRAKVCPTFSWSVGQLRFVTDKSARLLVGQEHITMQTTAFRRSRSNILWQNISSFEVVARDVYYKPMLPLSGCWLCPRWGIRICQKFTFPLSTFWPFYTDRLILDFSRCQFVSLFYDGTTIVLDVDSSGWCNVDDIRDNCVTFHCSFVESRRSMRIRRMELKIRTDKNGKSMGAGDLLLLRLGNDYGYSSDKELYEGERLTYELQRFKS